MVPKKQCLHFIKNKNLEILYENQGFLVERIDWTRTLSCLVSSLKLTNLSFGHSFFMFFCGGSLRLKKLTKLLAVKSTGASVDFILAPLRGRWFERS